MQIPIERRFHRVALNDLRRSGSKYTQIHFNLDELRQSLIAAGLSPKQAQVRIQNAALKGNSLQFEDSLRTLSQPYLIDPEGEIANARDYADLIGLPKEVRDRMIDMALLRGEKNQLQQSLNSRPGIGNFTLDELHRLEDLKYQLGELEICRKDYELMLRMRGTQDQNRTARQDGESGNL